jgi:signal transduction histidine kinase
VRVRLALLSASLVAIVGALVAAGGYLALRASLLDQAEGQARGQAKQLAELVDVPQGPGGGNAQGQANLVDIDDMSLSREFARAGLLVSVVRPSGELIQASGGGGAALRLPAALRARCLSTGAAGGRQGSPAAAVACRRIGPASAPVGMVLVGAPLAAARASLVRLATALAIGLGLGVLLAATASLLVASRALRPARRIAETAMSIRAGDLSRRIDYRGPRDELGTLAGELDRCFAELEQAVERQGDFVADASHELKTPIAAMRAHVDLLRGWAGVEPAAREAALDALDQAARGVGRLVADLLYLTELDRRPPLVRLPVDLDQVLVNVVREAQPLRPEVPIRVERLDECAVVGDELRLHQLLLNLVDNALRVSPPGGTIEVALAVAGDRVEVTVSDEGPGIPPERIERIFERFVGAGTGLGLAIAREIARAHGGDVTARNRAAGAVFELELPRAGASSNPHDGLIEVSEGSHTVPQAHGK